jgi:hypothetical protein
MEDELRLNLLRCAEAYAKARGIGLPTLARLAAGDWRFFDRLSDGDKTFTARKYDEVIQWFSDNWPDDLAWVDGVARPARAEPERAAS